MVTLTCGRFGINFLSCHARGKFIYNFEIVRFMLTSYVTSFTRRRNVSWPLLHVNLSVDVGSSTSTLSPVLNFDQNCAGRTNSLPYLWLAQDSAVLLLPVFQLCTSFEQIFDNIVFCRVCWILFGPGILQHVQYTTRLVPINHKLGTDSTSAMGHFPIRK